MSKITRGEDTANDDSSASILKGLFFAFFFFFSPVWGDEERPPGRDEGRSRIWRNSWFSGFLSLHSNPSPAIL